MIRMIIWGLKTKFLLGIEQNKKHTIFDGHIVEKFRFHLANFSDLSSTLDTYIFTYC